MPWSHPHSSPVAGCQSKPMVWRRPEAKIVRYLPAGVRRRIAALSGLLSLHTLQVEPMPR